MDAFYKQYTLPGHYSRQAIPVPERIGPYFIERPISRGGMGVLYLGSDPTTKQSLAIKVLSPKFANNQEAVQRFLQEARIIGSTKHPHIVTIYGEGTWDGGLYIAMEFVDGITLSQYILQKACSLKRAVDLLVQIASALAHLHKEGIVHRDLKPENILLTKEGNIKVIDFGIAQLHKMPQVVQTGIVGTPSYLSPEQREHPDQAGFASDIYAFGVIAYELILGKLSCGAIDLSLIPRGIRSIIEKALAFSMKDRYTQFVDIISDLRGYVSSAEFDRDRSKNDITKEMQESLQELHTRLFYPHMPAWPDIELGFCVEKTAESWGLYCDFFKYPDQKKLILFAESCAHGVQAPMHIALFKGIAYGLLHGTSAPEPSMLLDALHRLVKEAVPEGRFFLQLLLLDAINDTLTYASCGSGGCLRLPEGKKTAHAMHAENLALGDVRPHTFAQATDGWFPGDRVALHSVATSQELEKNLAALCEKNAYLSSQGQADALFKVLSSPGSGLKATLSLRRLD